jgi:ribosomal protein S18 acetylase RimI-like enzyme
MREFELVDRNLRTALQFFGTAMEGGELSTSADVDTIYCGLNYGVFNMALLNGPTASLAPIVESCTRFFDARAVRWSFWLCEDWLDAPLRRRARDEFADAGLRIITKPPGMLAEDLRAPVYGLPRLEIRAVKDQPTRDAFSEITGLCFDIPYSVCQNVYAPERAWNGAYQGYVGYWEGKAVTIAALCASEGALGIYSVGTLPEYRRRGYSEAMLRQVIGSVRRGREPIVLQSSEAGYRLYRRLGFRDVTKYLVFLTK